MSIVSQGESTGGSSSLRLEKRRRRRSPKDPLLNHGEAGSILAVSGTESMLGQTVTGFVEATFDAGYVLTVRISESDVTLRGLVFKPGCYFPITGANDVAPCLPMIHRTEAVLVAPKRKCVPEKEYSPVLQTPASDPTGTQSGNRREITDLPAVVGLDHSTLDSPKAKQGTDKDDIHGLESTTDSVVFSAQEAGNAKVLFDSLDQQPVHAFTTSFNGGTGRMTELLEAVEENIKESQVQTKEEPASMVEFDSRETENTHETRR